MQEEILDKLFSVHGKRLELDVNSPFLATDPGTIWYIHHGKINLSGTQAVGDSATGKVQDFATLKKGEAFPGIPLNSYNALAFLASPQEQSVLYAADLEALKRIASTDEEFSSAFENLMKNWVTVLFYGIEQGFTRKTVEADVRLRPGKHEPVLRDQLLSSNTQVTWCEPSNPNGFLYHELAVVQTTETGILLPLSRKVLVHVLEDMDIECPPPERIIHHPGFWKGLKVFHEVVMETQRIRLKEEDQREIERLIRKHQQADSHLEELLNQAEKVLNHAVKDSYGFEFKKSANKLFNVLQIVAHQQSISLTHPPDLDNSEDPLEDISRYSHVRYREIILEGEWYKSDAGPFLGFLAEDQTPVAMLPAKNGKYQMVLSEAGEKTPVTADNFRLLSNAGFMLYKPLQAEVKNLKMLMQYCIPKDRSDYYFYILLGFLVTILGMVTPFFTSIIFDHIILNAEKRQLIFVGLGIGMAGIAGFLFELSKSFSMLRIESRMDSTLQAGVWDRILNLPTTFFTQFSAGDLANRSLGINQIRQELSGIAISTILAGLFSVINLVLLFYYNVNLALVAILIVLVQVSLNFLFASIQIKRQKTLAEQTGKMEGIVLQMLNGIVKFRVSGTEHKAFGHWFKHYLPIKHTSIRLSNTQSVQVLVNTYFSFGTMMVLYVLMSNFSSQSHMTLGEFLGFNAAFGIFSSCLNALSNALIGVFNIFPIYDRTKPILETPIENNVVNQAPGPLKGSLDLSHISFRYEKESPLILDDVSIEIKNGEYVAFVGPSGSGKSTLLRLILGFNKPDSGNIYFDGQNMNALDSRMIRQQMGVVLQNGSLMSGEIYKNINGSSNTLNVNDAWDAAKQAAFDEDVSKMPMGMFTMVSESGGTISGGQKQRLMIARALVNKPRILIFDEATSALDNHTQAIVTESLDQLEVTRIVVAHRLSTIKGAHTIYYLEGGKVVEKGGFAELMDLKGKFFELANRQIE